MNTNTILHAISMEHTFSVEAMICGYCEYQDVFDAGINETFRCEREVENIHDTSTVAVKKDNKIATVCF